MGLRDLQGCLSGTAGMDSLVLAEHLEPKEHLELMAKKVSWVLQAYTAGMFFPVLMKQVEEMEEMMQ